MSEPVIDRDGFPVPFYLYEARCRDYDQEAIRTDALILIARNTQRIADELERLRFRWEAEG